MAVLLPEIGFPDHFHWLRHTILNDRNVSHHHGFHMLLVPFVYASERLADRVPDRFRQEVDPPGKPSRRSGIAAAFDSWLDSPHILGAKVCNVLLFGMVVMVAMWVMGALNVGARWFFLCAILALPTDFFLRMAYIRAPSASLIVLLLAYLCCIRGRYVWLAVLGAGYCHLYGGFVLYPPVVAIVALCYGLLHRNWRKCFALLAAGFMGLLVGLVTHPYFPQNIAFLGVQLFETGLQTAAVDKVRVGSEWKPINIYYWLQISGFTLGVLFLSLTLRARRRRLLEPETASLLILNVLFLVLCLWARRFIEYWPMFALLSAASLWRGFDASALALQTQVSEVLPQAGRLLSALRRRLMLSVCLIALLAGCVTLTLARDLAKCKFDIPAIRGVMAFFGEHTPAQSLIFTDDWDEFPMYFYYNSHNDYVCGLDPQFTNSKDPVLWERFCVITQGRSPRQSSVRVRAASADGIGESFDTETFRVRLADIRDHFQADYVLVGADHQPLYRQLRSAPEAFSPIYPTASKARIPAKLTSYAVFQTLSDPQGRSPDPSVPRETRPDRLKPPDPPPGS